MNGLFLSGESLYNKDWMEGVVDNLSPMFNKTMMHEYRHWEQGGPIDFSYELSHIIEEVDDHLAPYLIFAKSAGSVLSMLGIARGALDPEFCVFVGVPLPLAKRTEDALAYWSRNYHKGSLFIQNDHDPLTSAQELDDYLVSIQLQNYELVTLPGDSHNYADLPKLHELVEKHLH